MGVAETPGLIIAPGLTESQSMTNLRWCPSCDRYVHDLPDEHAEFHIGRDVFNSRTPEARAEWTKILAVAGYGTAA